MPFCEERSQWTTFSFFGGLVSPPNKKGGDRFSLVNLYFPERRLEGPQNNAGLTLDPWKMMFQPGKDGKDLI